MMPLLEADTLISLALREDIGDGDITTSSIIQRPVNAAARLIAQQRLVLAGLDIVQRVFEKLDPEVKVRKNHTDGEAVGTGMVYEAELSRLMGRTDDATVRAISAAVEAYDLPPATPQGISPDELMTSMELDKKNVAGSLTFILPERIGSVSVVKGVAPEQVRRTLLGRPRPTAGA
jgi:hypothetical protein